MAPTGRLQLQLLLANFYNFNSPCQTSTTSTAPARRLQLQQLLPDVYNFNSCCQTSTTSPPPTLMVPRPRHVTLMTPGPNM
uniref:Uncharacterized protein n=1 Tax=Meloidogyne incognita TaxID=6306 RepID=A0A914KR86_MELIC